MKNEGLSEKRKWEMLGEKIIFKVVFKGGGGGGNYQNAQYIPL